MAHSPGTSPRGKSWQGRVRTWNPDALRKITAHLAAHDPSLSDLEDDVSEKQSHKSSNPKKRSVLHSVSPRELSPYRHESKIRLKQLKEMQEMDGRMIHERCAREARQREEKFEKMLDEIQMQDENRVNAGRMLEIDEEKNLEQKKRLYDSWNKEVNGRMQYFLWRGLNPSMAHAQDEEEDQEGQVDEQSNLQREVKAGDDPLKKALTDASNEDAFRRTADSIIYGIKKHDERNQRQGNNSRMQEGPSLKELDTLWNKRETTRPVLAPPNWGQLSYSSTSYGFFASSRVDERGTFFTQRRMTQRGNAKHLPQDTDGIMSGGTIKTRTSGFNDYGILTGEWGRRGQSSLLKQPHGPSNGAPNQDHYTYESGHHVADLEFPLGKRIMKNMH